MSPSAKPRVLCVDDEENVLAGLSLHLARRYGVATALSGSAGLEVLQQDAAIAVIVSDMRMPRMDGATFLRKAREVAPDAVRILLTGHAELDAAIAAVNDGQVFRFLVKPCAPPYLLGVIEAAVEQHRLVTSERVLLQQTLHGSIKALVDVLALASPTSFGRSSRLKQLVADMATALDLPDRWQVEVAAMLSQLGSIMLPPQIAEKAYFGEALTESERAMTARVPVVTEELLGQIPRLEPVRAILARYARRHEPIAASGTVAEVDVVVRGARLLRAAHDFDVLEAQGHSPAAAIGSMRTRISQYGRDVLDALGRVRGGDGPRHPVREIAASAVQVGMVLAADVKLATGVLLAARGYTVTSGFVERVRNFHQGLASDKVLVITGTQPLD